MTEYYYGITPSSDFFAHYGVKGMKWGIRKAIERGNDRAVSRAYHKAERKLQKLQAKANSQALLRRADRLDKVSRGARVAGRVGLGAAVAGTGGSALISKVITPGTIDRYNKMKDTVQNTHHQMYEEAAKYNGSHGTMTQQQVRDSLAKQKAELKEAYDRDMNLNDKLRGAAHNVQAAGAGVAALGYGTALGAKLRANALRRRAGNAEKMKAARQKAEAYRREMNKAFAGTKYASKNRRH